jgi:SAM-dependent methyltransferase
MSERPPGLAFDAETARGIEALYRSPDAVRRRSRALELVAPRTGERILDVGCGPGFLTALLADAVGPTGAVCAIDTSEPMLELARRRCAVQPWVELRAGDAGRPELPASSFDACLSVQVHEYVRDVAGSLRTIARGLRPGGRLLLVATDWDSIVWAAGDGARMTRVLSAFEEHLAHLDLPRRLAPLLREAGLALRRCEVLVQHNLALDPNTYPYGLMELIRRFVPGRRGVTREEADAWAADLLDLEKRGASFFSLNQYFFLAEKPS